MSRSAVDRRAPTARPDAAAASGSDTSSFPSHCRRAAAAADVATDAAAEH